MHDREGNTIEIAGIPNPNLLVWGKSGQGKTYFLCREIEKAVNRGKKVLIVDYSGSYTRQELTKNQFRFSNELRELNPYEHPVFWYPYYQESQAYCCDLADSLSEVLNLKSYFQKKWLKQAVVQHIQSKMDFQLGEFMETLENLYQEVQKESSHADDRENLKRLLTRFSQFQMMKNFHVKRKTQKKSSSARVTVMQVSQFPEQERRFLAEFLLTFFWKSTLRRENDWQTLVLDEIQFLKLEAGTAFSGILREGRKYGLSAFLSTQFISAYAKENLESLLQAGSIMIFKPTPRDLKFSASVVEPQDVRTWQKILQSLAVGSAVLVGNYRVNAGSSLCSEPVVCQVV